MIKWANRILKTGGWGTAGGYGAAVLAKAYPATFAWLEPILAYLPRLH